LPNKPPEWVAKGRVFPKKLPVPVAKGTLLHAKGRTLQAKGTYPVTKGTVSVNGRVFRMVILDGRDS
jgi:hypothetical protein